MRACEKDSQELKAAGYSSHGPDCRLGETGVAGIVGGICTSCMTEGLLAKVLKTDAVTLLLWNYGAEKKT